MKPLLTNGTLQPFTPVFCIPFPHVEHSLSLLLDFSWLQATSLAFLYHWVWNFLFYRHFEKFYTAISSVIDLSNKFVDWKCFGDGLCLIDAFRFNYFIRFRQVHSNNRWHKFHGSIRKLFGCMDHNLAWLSFSANDVLGGYTYVIHWDFAMVLLIVEPEQWII